MILPESPGGSGAPIGFINLGSLADQLPRKRLGPSRQRATHGPAQVSKQQARRAIQSTTGRSGRGRAAPIFDSGPPLRSARSDSSCLRTASPTERSGQSTTSDSDSMSSTGGTQKPCSPLFSDWRNQSRLGPTDRGRPSGKDQGTNGESKARRSSQTMIPGTVPCHLRE